MKRYVLRDMLFDKIQDLEYDFPQSSFRDYSESPYFQVMTTHKKKRFDFFAAYHKEKLSKVASYLFSGAFALLLAFSFVSYSQNGDMKGLMASVANLTPSVEYSADIVMSHSGESLSMVFGSEAKHVENISFTLVTNPEKVQNISSTDSRVALSSLAGGMYHGLIHIGNQDIHPGQELLKLKIDASGESPISLIDTKFVSEGSEYELTNIVQE